MIHRDRDKRPRLRAVAIAAAIVVAGAAGFIAFVPEGVRDVVVSAASTGAVSPMAYPRADAASPLPAPATAPPAIVAKAATRNPSGPLDAEYRRLMASTSPEDHAKAYRMAAACLRENYLSTVQFVAIRQPDCKLGDGTWGDRQLRKIAVRDYALTAQYGGVMAVWSEGPRGMPGYQAFADDPQAWDALMQSAKQVAIERGEPVALNGESRALFAKGDALLALGNIDDAKAAYMESLANAVASRAGTWKENSAVAGAFGMKLKPFDPATDPNVQSDLKNYGAVLSGVEQASSINEGLRRAEKWRRS